MEENKGKGFWQEAQEGFHRFRNRTDWSDRWYHIQEEHERYEGWFRS